jgi:isochorismate pyruvate lyase
MASAAAMAQMMVMSTPNAYLAPDPEACRTMSDVRAGVDEIDRLLAPLIARRQRYMDAAARIKPDRGAVRDAARIAKVLENVRRNAAGAGLAWAIAEPVWRAMIEACIAYEFAVFDARRGPGAKAQRSG